MATAAEITGWITEAEGQRHKVAMGQTFIEVWRDGRRVTVQVPNIAALNGYISNLRADLVSAQLAEGITPTHRRRAIGLAYRN